MPLSEKIVKLRKSSGLSQEELAAQLHVSRQAVSRWEVGSALPDASNILLLSRLFGVTADYLLCDEYESANDPPKVQEVTPGSTNQKIRLWVILLVTLECMLLLMQIFNLLMMKNPLVNVLCMMLLAAAIGCFECLCHCSAAAGAPLLPLRCRFYRITVWLGAYFPIRAVAAGLARLYPHSFNTATFELLILGVYLLISGLASVLIRSKRRHTGAGKPEDSRPLNT